MPIGSIAQLPTNAHERGHVRKTHHGQVERITLGVGALGQSVTQCIVNVSLEDAYAALRAIYLVRRFGANDRADLPHSLGQLAGARGQHAEGEPPAREHADPRRRRAEQWSPRSAP